MHLAGVRSHRPHQQLLTAIAIIVTLLLCPALNRVVRVQPLAQNPSTSTTYTPSFQRSLDVPPEPHVVIPDTQIVLLITADLARPTSVTRWLRPADDILPLALPLVRPRSLRAPPAA